jgi:hypothetical protein
VNKGDPMNNNDERLVDTIKNVKTSTVKNGLGRLLRGCWKLFLVAVMLLSVASITAHLFDNSYRYIPYILIPLILSLIELKTNKISDLFFGMFK